ncbi:hypothetical protein RI367_002143 [Sorochytrium milnesiophthora]
MAPPADSAQQDMYYRANISTQYVKQTVPPEKVLECLYTTNSMLASITFGYATVDKPPHGFTMYFLAMSQDEPPPDGYIWLDSEVPKSIPIDSNRVIMMFERRQGVVPGEHTVSMTKRRYQLQVNGQALQVQLVHYLEADESTRSVPVNAANFKTPARRQPIAQPAASPVQHPPAHLHAASPYMPTATRLQTVGHPSPAVRSPHAAVPATKRKSQVPHTAQRPKQQARTAAPSEDQLLADDIPHFSARDVAMARFKRNHEFMEDILSMEPTPSATEQATKGANKDSLQQRLVYVSVSPRSNRSLTVDGQAALKSDLQGLKEQEVKRVAEARQRLSALSQLATELDLVSSSSELDAHVAQAESALSGKIRNPSPASRRRATPTKSLSQQQQQQQQNAPGTPSPQVKRVSTPAASANKAAGIPHGYNAVRDITTPVLNACIAKMSNTTLPSEAQILELAEYLDTFTRGKVAELNGLPSFIGKHYSFGDCGNDLSFSSPTLVKFLRRSGAATCSAAFAHCVQRIIEEHRQHGNTSASLFDTLGQQVVTLAIMLAFPTSVPGFIDAYFATHNDFANDPATSSVLTWLIKLFVCSTEPDDLPARLLPMQQLWQRHCAPFIPQKNVYTFFPLNAIDLALLILRKIQSASAQVDPGFFRSLVLSCVQVDRTVKKGPRLFEKASEMVELAQKQVVQSSPENAVACFSECLRSTDRLQLSDEAAKELANVLSDLLFQSPSSGLMVQQWVECYAGNIKATRFVTECMLQKSGLLPRWRKVEQRSTKVWREYLPTMYLGLDRILNKRGQWAKSEPAKNGVSKKEVKECQTSVYALQKAALPRAVSKALKKRGRSCLWAKWYNVLTFVLLSVLLWRALASTRCAGALDETDETLCRLKSVVVPPVEQMLDTCASSQYARALKEVFVHPAETVVAATGLFEMFTEFGDTYEDVRVEYLQPLANQISNSGPFAAARNVYDTYAKEHMDHAMSEYGRPLATFVVREWQTNGKPLLRWAVDQAQAAIKHGYVWVSQAFSERGVPATRTAMRHVITSYRTQIKPTVSVYAKHLLDSETYRAIADTISRHINNLRGTLTPVDPPTRMRTRTQQKNPSPQNKKNQKPQRGNVRFKKQPAQDL